MKCTPEQVARLEEEKFKLRSTLNGEVYPIVDRWMRHALKSNKLKDACILHAHLVGVGLALSSHGTAQAFMYGYTPAVELDETSVKVFLSSQVFLVTRYEFQSGASHLAGAQRATEDVDIFLGLPETELFDMFHKQRKHMFQWLFDHPVEADRIFEEIVRVCTLTGDNFDQEVEARHWACKEGFDCCLLMDCSYIEQVYST